MPKVTACSTLAFALSPLEVALRHIAAYGFTQVEIAEMLTHSKHFPIETVDPHEVRRLLDQYSLRPIAANVTCADRYTGQPGVLKAPVGTQSSAETVEVRQAKQQRVYYRLHVESEALMYRDRVRTLIDKTQAAGIPQLVLSVGRKEHVNNFEGDLKSTAAVLDELSEDAAQVNVKILLEMPHVWQLYDDADKSKRMVDTLQSDNIGVLIDSTHWHVNGYDLDDYVCFLGDRLWHVHLRDAAGQDTVGGNYQLEITPGQGEVDFKLLGEILDKYDYCGDVTLETEYKNYQDPSEVDRENAFAFAHLRSVGWEVAADGL